MLKLKPVTALTFKIGVPYLVVRVEKNGWLNVTCFKALKNPVSEILSGGRRQRWFRAEVSYVDINGLHSYECDRVMVDVGMPEWDESIEHEHRTFLDTPENRLVLEHLQKQQNVVEYRRIIAT